MFLANPKRGCHGILFFLGSWDFCAIFSMFRGRRTIAYTNLVKSVAVLAISNHVMLYQWSYRSCNGCLRSLSFRGMRHLSCWRGFLSDVWLDFTCIRMLRLPFPLDKSVNWIFFLLFFLFAWEVNHLLWIETHVLSSAVLFEILQYS